MLHHIRHTILVLNRLYSTKYIQMIQYQSSMSTHWRNVIRAWGLEPPQIFKKLQ